MCGPLTLGLSEPIVSLLREGLLCLEAHSLANESLVVGFIVVSAVRGLSSAFAGVRGPTTGIDCLRALNANVGLA